VRTRNARKSGKKVKKTIDKVVGLDGKNRTLILPDEVKMATATIETTGLDVCRSGWEYFSPEPIDLLTMLKLAAPEWNKVVIIPAQLQNPKDYPPRQFRTAQPAWQHLFGTWSKGESPSGIPGSREPGAGPGRFPRPIREAELT
jgi:hypothetical protein